MNVTSPITTIHFQIPKLQKLISEVTVMPMGYEERQFCGKEYARIFYFGVPIFFIVAFMICGNLMVVISVLRYKNLRSIRNGIIVSLALADLLVAVAVVPFAAIDLICRRWIFPPSYCISYVALDFISCQSSIFHICLIAVEQYVVISSPLKYGRIRKVVKVGVIIAVCGTWALSIVIAYYFTYFASRSGNLSHNPEHESDIGFKRDVESKDHALYHSKKQLGDESCLYLSKLSTSFALTVFLGGFLVPMVITMLVYWKIYGIARYHLNSLLNQYNTTLSQQQLNLKKSRQVDLVKSIELLTTTPDTLNKIPYYPPSHYPFDGLSKRRSAPSDDIVHNNLRKYIWNDDNIGPKQIFKQYTFSKKELFNHSQEKPVRALRFQLVEYKSPILQSTNDNVVTSLIKADGNLKDRLENNLSNLNASCHKFNKANMIGNLWTNCLGKNPVVNAPFTINLTSDFIRFYEMVAPKIDDRDTDTIRNNIPVDFTNHINRLPESEGQNCQCHWTKNSIVKLKEKQLLKRGDTLKLSLCGDIGAKDNKLFNESEVKHSKTKTLNDRLFRLHDDQRDLTNDSSHSNQLLNNILCESGKVSFGLQRRSTSHSVVISRRSTEFDNSKVLRRCSSGYGSTLLYTPPTNMICHSESPKNLGKAIEIRSEDLTTRPAAFECKRPQGALKRESNIYVHIQTNRSMLKEGKAIKTLGIVLGAFLMCWTPYFCLFLIHPLCNYCIPVKLFVFVTWLGYMNSALNPIIYAIYNKKFRRAFKSLIFCHVMKRSVINAP